MDELTDDQKEILAREVAADDWPDAYGKRAFLAGWQAAADYYAERQVQPTADAD